MFAFRLNRQRCQDDEGEIEMLVFGLAFVRQRKLLRLAKMERFRSEVCSKLKRDYTAGMRIVQPAVCAKCRAVITPLVHPFRMEKTSLGTQ